MPFKKMNENLLLSILEKEKDILTPLAEKDMENYSGFSCPRCGGNVVLEADIKHILNSSNRLFPKKLARCVVCGCLTDPISKIVLEMGNLGKCEPIVPLIHSED